ncbi:hypothetical protein [Polynucleobacter paneuropaeus]|jgi:hypothetical protein|uniref:hypothetical protein n=1 Tax=Polynucleobacter paneuropaeus TaxID=2527775 RepID=UPI0011B934D6|nr:hypothetical protein [Polynucleobacter paneuropaeus]
MFSELKISKLLLFIVLLSLIGLANADCVYGAKSKTKFIVLDSHALILKGGYGKDILIKTFSFINSGSSISILKDDFCSYESAVLYIDGQLADANEVKWL